MSLLRTHVVINAKHEWKCLLHKVLVPWMAYGITRSHAPLASQVVVGNMVCFLDPFRWINTMVDLLYWAGWLVDGGEIKEVVFSIVSSSSGVGDIRKIWFPVHRCERAVETWSPPSLCHSISVYPFNQPQPVSYVTGSHNKLLNRTLQLIFNSHVELVLVAPKKVNSFYFCSLFGLFSGQMVIMENNP